MADQIVQLQIKVNAETGQLSVVHEGLKEVASGAEKAEKSFLGLKGTTGDLVKEILPFATAVGAGSFAIYKLTGFISDAIKESEEYRQSLVRMRSALETTGGSWEKSGKAIEGWADAIQSSTRFSDNQALASLDRLTRATGNLRLAQGLTTLAMDIHVKTGQELGTVTDMLTRLSLNQNRALAQAKLEYGDVLSGATDYKDAINRLATAYGGAAVEERSLTSETSKLKNEWQDLQKNIGNFLTPALVAVLETVNEMVPSFEKLWIVAKSLATKGVIGTAIGFNDLKASFAEVERLAAEAQARADQLKNSAGSIGDALNGYSAPPPTDQKTEETTNAKKELDDRLAQMEDELNIKMASLGEDSLAKKLARNNAEMQAEVSKVDRLAAIDQQGEVKKNKQIEAIKAYYRKKDEEATKLDVKFKTQMALEAASTAISALQMLNSASEMKSKADARRAKMLLALQQAITIANIWASNTSLGPWGVAKSIAETGLAVAQFAVQSKAIDKAVAANQQQATETSISTPLTNGETLTETFQTGNGSTGQSGGVGTGGGSGFSGGGGGGGGGAGTIINIGPTTVHFAADSVDVNNIDMIARRIGEAVSRGNVEAAQMALALYRSGQKQEGLAR